MLCPKCKNPIDDNVAVCEWCGASFVPIENNNKNDISNFDSELLSLLEKGQKQEAIKLYQKRTGEPNKPVCVQYIERLDFFRTHEFATEDTWKKEFARQNLRKSHTGCLLLLLVFVVIMTLFGLGWAFSIIKGGIDLPEFGVKVTFVGIILTILIILILIVRKIHKK